MVAMPNGRKADEKNFHGQLLLAQNKLVHSLLLNPELNRLTHTRQCLDMLRQGEILRPSSRVLQPSANPVSLTDWGQVYGAWHEFCQTLTWTKVYLEADHLLFCLAQLEQGQVLERNLDMRIRPPAEQFACYLDYNQWLQSQKDEYQKSRVIPDAHLKQMESVVRSGVLADDDLLFYGHGDVLSTALLADYYAVSCGATSEGSNGPYFSRESTDATKPSTGFIGTTQNKCLKPDGFYVRRMTPEDRRLGIGRGKNEGQNFLPMGSEAFQLFGILYKRPADLWRVPILVLPGLYMPYYYTKPENENKMKVEQVGEGRFGISWPDPEIRTTEVTLGTTDSFFGTRGYNLSLNTILALKQKDWYWYSRDKVGCGYLASWSPRMDKPSPIQSRKCSACQSAMYAYDNFSICSYCGQITA